MKQSLTSFPGSVAAVYDVLATGLAGSAWNQASLPLTPAARAAESRPSAPRRTLLDRFERAVWRSRQQALERYLAESTDLADLERRLRRVERNGCEACA